MVIRLRFVCAIFCAALMVVSTVGCQSDDQREPVSADDVRPGVAHARRALKRDWEGLLLDQERKQLNATPIARYFSLKTPPNGLVHREALHAFYRGNDWRPIFVDDAGTPNFRARAAVQEAQDADRHALPPQKYLRPSIRSLIRQHDELLHAWTMSPLPTLNTKDWETLEALLEEPEIKKDKHPLTRILPRILNAGSPLPDLHHAWENRLLIRRALIGTSALLELTIADAWLDWAYDMSDGYWTKVDDKANAEAQEQIRQSALLASMKAIARADTPEAATNYIQSKIPHYEQYERLLEARKRYVDIVENGGWPEVPSNRHARRGSRGPYIQTLKERLQIEGYYHGPIDDRFDNALEDAVKKYQETHQFQTDGASSANFWSSLNVSAEDRLAQIELTLQRWRESRIGDDEYYILINIPDFHTEVWRNGVREMRFRIVVGNTLRQCRNDKLIYVNATPIQSSAMDHVILNPYWTVPQRITTEEILPAYVEDPEYLERNNYEKITASNGFTMVRQLPGPNNALGRVKFMFPNSTHTYMHDTPRKVYFDSPTRAFSHGCMRVQDPLDFMQYLLVNDDNWDQRSIDAIFERGREYRLNLKNPVPIHAEYYVVRVDDEGHVNFLADLYRHDRERLDLSYEREPACQPPKDTRPRFRLDTEGVVRRLNEEGEWVDVREEAEEELLAEDYEEEYVLDGEEPLPVAPPGLPMDMGP